MDVNGDGDYVGLGGLVSKLRVSGMIGDSIMMGIVNSAMEQAFDKAFRCKEGIIWRLNQKSRFCELAIMQLEWCLMFVQQEIETTRNNDLVLFDDNEESLSSPSSCVQLHKKLILDLTDTRDRIQCHLRETEFALWDKDRELSDVTPRSRDLLLLNNGTVSGGGDDDGSDDFCELKNSVDQQFFNIKQNLEDERVNFNKGGTGEEVEAGMVVNKEEEKEHHFDDRREDNFGGPNTQYLNRSTGYEKMQWDIDILKDTFDIALGMMSKATSLAEVGPIERQWRWEVEKDTMALVFRGFLGEIQHADVGDSWWSSLMVEIASLRHQLHHLITENEDNSVTTTTPPPTTSMCVNTTSGVSSTQNSTGEKEKEEREQGQGSLVAEMIRNHESIIRQRSEELNWIKGEIVLRTGSVLNNSDTSKDRDVTVTTRTRIQHLISRLDTVLAQNPRGRLQQQQDFDFGSDADSMLIGTMVRHNIFVVVVKEWMKDLHSRLYNEDIIKEESGCQVEAYVILGNELDNLDIQIESLRTLEDDVYLVFFREMVQELKEQKCLECFNSNREECLRALEDDVYMVFFKEMVQELKEQKYRFDMNQEEKLESLRSLEDDVYMVVFREMVLELKEQQCSFDRCQEEKLESLRRLEDDVYMVFFRKMIQELKERQCRFDGNQEEKLESLRCLEDDVYMVFFREMVQELKEQQCSFDRNQEENFESLRTLEDDVYMVFIRKMVQELKERQCRFDRNQEENIESLRSLEYDVYMVFFRGMVQELMEEKCRTDRNQEEKLEGLRKLEDDVYMVFFKKMVQELKEQQCCFDENQEENIESLRRLEDDVYMVFFRGMVQELKEEKCHFAKNQEEKLESLRRLEDDVYMVFFTMMFQELKEQQCRFHGNQDENLESLRKLEDDVYMVFLRGMVQELKEQKYCFDRNQEEKKESLRRVEDDVYVVYLREIVQELKEQNCIECYNRNQEEKSHQFLNPNDIRPDLYIPEKKGEDLRRQRKNALKVASISPSLLSSLTTFSKEMVAFNTMVHDKIQLSVSRLEELKSQVIFCQEHVILARKREFMYKNAFLLRCCNLQKAEVEVDLLADELEDLLILVEKIYITLDHYSPVLQHHLGIYSLKDSSEFFSLGEDDCLETDLDERYTM